RPLLDDDGSLVHGRHASRVPIRFVPLRSGHEEVGQGDGTWKFPSNMWGMGFLCLYSIISRQNLTTDPLVAFEQAIRLDSNFTRGFNNKGTVLANLKRYNEALTAYEQAALLDP